MNKDYDTMKNLRKLYYVYYSLRLYKVSKLYHLSYISHSVIETQKKNLLT